MSIGGRRSTQAIICFLLLQSLRLPIAVPLHRGEDNGFFQFSFWASEGECRSFSGSWTFWSDVSIFGCITSSLLQGRLASGFYRGAQLEHPYLFPEQDGGANEFQRGRTLPGGEGAGYSSEAPASSQAGVGGGRVGRTEATMATRNENLEKDLGASDRDKAASSGKPEGERVRELPGGGFQSREGEYSFPLGLGGEPEGLEGPRSGVGTGREASGQLREGTERGGRFSAAQPRPGFGVREPPVRSEGPTSEQGGGERVYVSRPCNCRAGLKVRAELPLFRPGLRRSSKTRRGACCGLRGISRSSRSESDGLWTPPSRIDGSC